MIWARCLVSFVGTLSMEPEWSVLRDAEVYALGVIGTVEIPADRGRKVFVPMARVLQVTSMTDDEKLPGE